MLGPFMMGLCISLLHEDINTKAMNGALQIPFEIPVVVIMAHLQADSLLYTMGGWTPLCGPFIEESVLSRLQDFLFVGAFKFSPC